MGLYTLISNIREFHVGEINSREKKNTSMLFFHVGELVFNTITFCRGDYIVAIRFFNNYILSSISVYANNRFIKVFCKKLKNG